MIKSFERLVSNISHDSSPEGWKANNNFKEEVQSDSCSDIIGIKEEIAKINCMEKEIGNAEGYDKLEAEIFLRKGIVVFKDTKAGKDGDEIDIVEINRSEDKVQ